MKKLFLALCMALTAGIMLAQTPVQSQTVIGKFTTTAIWAVPSTAYGPLLTLQPTGMISGATLKVQHVIPFIGGALTNTVTTAGAADTQLAFASAYNHSTNSTVALVIAPNVPVWLARGDSLLFTVSATNAVDATIVIRSGISR